MNTRRDSPPTQDLYLFLWESEREELIIFPPFVECLLIFLAPTKINRGFCAFFEIQSSRSFHVRFVIPPDGCPRAFSDSGSPFNVMVPVHPISPFLLSLSAKL